MMRGFSKHELGNYYEAIADYTKAIEIDPDYALGYANRGISKEFILSKLAGNPKSSL